MFPHKNQPNAEEITAKIHRLQLKQGGIDRRRVWDIFSISQRALHPKSLKLGKHRNIG